MDASNAKLQIETGQELQSLTEMADSGDQTIFTFTGVDVWSGRSGYTPSIRPSGIVSGRNLLTAHADDDKVSVAAFTAYSKGTLQTVTATTATITRASTASKAQVHSVTMASDGSIAVVEGTISASTSFSETRNAAGGPPYIPATSVEIGQIRVTSSTAAALDSDEIYQVIGTHTERYDYPEWTENNVGDGDNAASAAKKNAYVEFVSALSGIHTAGAAKEVYAQVYEPQFQEIQRASDFTPAEESHSVTSAQVYRRTVASRSSSLGQAGFTALLTDGVVDSLVGLKDEVATVKFYPDENRAPYILTQGKIGLTRTFPPDNQIQANVTISSEVKSAEFTS